MKNWSYEGNPGGSGIVVIFSQHSVHWRTRMALPNVTSYSGRADVLAQRPQVPRRANRRVAIPGDRS